jgi:hypothetical protein
MATIRALVKLGGWVSHSWRRIKDAEAEADACWADWVGKTTEAILDTVVAVYFIGMTAAGLARQYQTKSASELAFGASAGSGAVLTSCLYLLGAALIIGVWALLLVRWLRYMGWARVLAIPYLVFLCAMAWLFPQKLPEGLDWLGLLLLQSPIVVTVARRVHERAAPL